MSKASTRAPASDLTADVEVLFECMVDALIERGWDVKKIAAAIADRADDFVLDAYRMEHRPDAQALSLSA